MTKLLARSFILLSLMHVSAARAETKVVVPEVEGLAHTSSITPSKGFIDAPFALTEDGNKIVYVETDGSNYSTLVAREVATGSELARIDLTKTTQAPVELSWVGRDRFLVVSRALPSAKLMAHIVGGDKTLSFGPASAVHLATIRGRNQLVVHDVDEASQSGSGLVVHTVSRYDLNRGRLIGKKRQYVSDEAGRIEALKMKAMYWRDHDLTIVGIHDGGYNKKLDQNMPKYEAWYDLVAGRVTKKIIFEDYIAHREKLQILAAHSGENHFAFMARDLMSLRVSREGVIDVIDLVGSPLHHYDRGSLMYQQLADGSMLISLTIDPVHPEAAERKRAVPVWTDFYRLPAGEKRAIRVGRIRQADKRKRGWHAQGDTLAVLPQHMGWRRGGPYLNFYRLPK